MGLESYYDELNMRNSENVRIQVLQEEIYYYETLLQSEDTGNIHTTISFLKQRIDHLSGKKSWPFT